MKKKNELILEYLSRAISALFLTFVGMVSYDFVNYKKLDFLENVILLSTIFLNILILVILFVAFKKVLDKID